MSGRTYDDKYFYCEHCGGGFKSKNPRAVARHVTEKHGAENGREAAKAARGMKNMTKTPQRYR